MDTKCSRRSFCITDIKTMCRCEINWFNRPPFDDQHKGPRQLTLFTALRVHCTCVHFEHALTLTCMHTYIKALTSSLKPNGLSLSVPAGYVFGDSLHSLSFYSFGCHRLWRHCLTFHLFLPGALPRFPCPDQNLGLNDSTHTMKYSALNCHGAFNIN